MHYAALMHYALTSCTMQLQESQTVQSPRSRASFPRQAELPRSQAAQHHLAQVGIPLR